MILMLRQKFLIVWPWMTLMLRQKLLIVWLYKNDFNVETEASDSLTIDDFKLRQKLLIVWLHKNDFNVETEASDGLTMGDFNVETEACDVQSKIIITNFLTTKQSQQTRLVNHQTNLIKLYKKLSSNMFTCSLL